MVRNQTPKRSRFVRIQSWDRGVVVVGVVLLLAVGLTLVIRERQLAQERRLYEGHSIGEWVELALADHFADPDPDAVKMVLRIGPPAVPYLVDFLHRLRENRIHERLVHWQIKFLPEWCRWYELHPDVSGDVVAATRLLTALGEAARPAVSAIVRSADNVHYWAYIEILDDLAELGPVASAAVPWLQQGAKNGDVSAAWSLSTIVPGDDTFTRLVISTIQVQRRPSDASRELFWVREDTELNLKLVPLLAEVLGDASVAEAERTSAVSQLGYRGSDARSALPLMRLTASQTGSVALRKAITEAIAAIEAAEAAARTSAPLTVEPR